MITKTSIHYLGVPQSYVNYENELFDDLKAKKATFCKFGKHERIPINYINNISFVTGCPSDYFFSLRY